MCTVVVGAFLQNDASLPERTPFEVQDLRKLLQFCLENTYFVFQDCFYKQLQGTPMGASLSVTAANLTMESVERRAIATFMPQPRIFLRYVDDCFSVIKRDALDAFSSHLNSIEPAINITVELEKDRRLPFLDVLVQRQTTILRFNVYYNTTHTLRYLNFS